MVPANTPRSAFPPVPVNVSKSEMLPVFAAISTALSEPTVALLEILLVFNAMSVTTSSMASCVFDAVKEEALLS